MAAISLLEIRSALGATGGHFVYVLDDPYIHMAMARNIARHGAWGVTPFEFSNSSSSPLWLMMITAWYIIGGVSEMAPLVLNLLFGALLLLLCHGVLRRFLGRSVTVALVLLAIIVLTPLVPVAMTGLEHLLHATVALAFLYLASDIIAGADGGSRISLPEIALLAMAPILTAARYEGMFLIASAALLLFFRRKRLYAVLLVVAGLLPVIAYGLFSTSHGWEFLPNSLLLKGNVPHATLTGIAKLVGLQALKAFALSPHLLVLTVAGLAILYLRYARIGNLRDTVSTMLLVTLFTTVLHLQFARTGWFYRYEAYLMVMWMVAIGAALPDLGRALMPVLGRGRLSMVLAAAIPVLGMAPLVERSVRAYAEAPRASGNIYEQQYQMGLFLRKFFEGRGVAANDIGAINFLADIRCLDLWGLGSIDVARAKMRGSYGTAEIEQLARRKKIDIAVVYDEWYAEYGGLPRSWSKVGEWTISDNVIAGGTTVSFYAVDPAQASYLAEALKQFSDKLPRRVLQRGSYLQLK